MDEHILRTDVLLHLQDANRALYVQIHQQDPHHGVLYRMCRWL